MPLGGSDRERGASSVEYGLLLTGIAVIIIAAVFAFGDSVSDLFGSTCSSVATQVDSSC